MVVALVAAVVIRWTGDDSHQGTALAPPPTTTSTSTTTSSVVDRTAFACAPAGIDGKPDGTAFTTTATLGSVSATLAGAIAETGGIASLTSPTLTVVDDGHTVVHTDVAPPAVPPGDTSPGVMPIGIGPRPPAGQDTTADAESVPLCVAWFAGSPQPTVLLGLYLGGAHCCTILRSYSLGASSDGAPLDIDLGNPGAALLADGANTLVVTADDDFAYAFASFAGSGEPIKVLELSGHAFVDTTARHLDLVPPDAAKWFEAFLHTQDGVEGGLGLLAAWVADECRLGLGTQTWSTVNTLLGQGKLTRQMDPSGTAYVEKLRDFLATRHYC